MNKRSIIIDTDPGIDDALAIAIALFNEELDVKLITTVAGNVGLNKVTYNTLCLLKYFGKENIPVAMGADRPLIREYEDASSVHGKSGMEGFDFEKPTQTAIKENAVDAMRSAIMESEEPITLVPIAPLTNIALLLKTYPEVKNNIKEIVLMGGSASRGNKGVMSEYNIGVDPEAAHIVFHSGVKLTMVGLDVGLKALVLPEDSEHIKGMNKTGKMAYCLFKKYRGGSFNTGLKMYDSTAIAYLLKPELFEAVETYLDVELHGSMTHGCTLVDLKGYLGKANNATVCLDINGDEFRKWFVDAIEKCI
ncbi:ribonucleoside hydrolase RihC [Clostridium uliginosum]|uniref:Non-specific riboncleoside hydrolase n=1 Tax=Clostridium uliginosum TaxID=119641 RepID=A0A1I1RYB4_9CLOT|nr:ribonucleoside hydrolase RihC [Clostridium uliginosum]SFD37248.1 non-specific riboncleoside hydrolase [Clostridium uliginosum]